MTSNPIHLLIAVIEAVTLGLILWVTVPIAWRALRRRRRRDRAP